MNFKANSKQLLFTYISFNCSITTVYSSCIVESDVIDNTFSSNFKSLREGEPENITLTQR
jgi:hypothetical protein